MSAPQRSIGGLKRARKSDTAAAFSRRLLFFRFVLCYTTNQQEKLNMKGALIMAKTTAEKLAKLAQDKAAIVSKIAELKTKLKKMEKEEKLLKFKRIEERAKENNQNIEDLM